LQFAIFERLFISSFLKSKKQKAIFQYRHKSK
jgi:hypothetical protein